MSCLKFVVCNSQLPASWIFFTAFSLRMLSLWQFLVRPIATLLRNWVEVSHLQIWSRFCKDCAKCRSSYSLQIFRNVTSDPFETQVVLRTIVVSTFIDNFYDAFFQHRLVRNDGVDAVCQNSFLRRGQVNSVLCILFRSSMNMIIHLYSVPWYL